eukprot:279046_1
MSSNPSGSRSRSRKDLNFEMEHGVTQQQEYEEKIVEITRIEMPKHLADLDPALLEQARRILQQENYDLRKQMEQLVHELDQSQSTIQKKLETIKLQKNKTEDAEMACDRLLLQQQVLEERVESFEEDRKRERKEVESFKNENALQRKEIDALKLKITAKDKEIQETISRISAREAKRADEFIQQAIKQFKRLKTGNNNNQNNNGQQQQQNGQQIRNNRNGSSAYKMMNMSASQQQKEINRQKQVMEIQMQQLKQMTFEQLEKIQFEQMRVKGLLETKSQQYAK